LISTIKKSIKNKSIRKKIIATLLLLVVYRILANISLPNVNRGLLTSLVSNNSIFNVLNIFSGNGLSSFSLTTLGIGPYITASIIMQMLTYLLPSLETLSKEGGYGQTKINTYTRFLSIPLGALQGLGLYFLLFRQGIFLENNLFIAIVVILTMVAGSMVLLWLGDLITAQGISNGISLIILAGILSSLPNIISGLRLQAAQNNYLLIGLFILIGFIIIYGIVKVNEAHRRIPIEYSRGSGTYRFL